MSDHLEVAEYMVTSLHGASHPALLARPGSGIIFDGQEKRWRLDAEENSDGLDYDEIYQQCMIARDQLQATARKYRKKLKDPILEASEGGNWRDVDKFVQSACSDLETCVTRDKDLSGPAGKLKQAFRFLCKHAGAGQTFSNLIPNDGMNSVLCGGIKVIFAGLRQTRLYQEEIYKTLEELPIILVDHAAHVKIYNRDDELHRRTAALYVAVYKLLEGILLWFMKNSAITVIRILVDPPGFSDKLKENLAEVKLRAQYFETHALRLSRQVQDESMQLQYWATYMQDRMDQKMQAVLDRTEFLEERLARTEVLENLDPFLQQMMDSLEQRVVGAQTLTRPQQKTRHSINFEDVLSRFLYDPEMLESDLAAIMKQNNVTGRAELSIDRVRALQSNARLRAWLAVDEPSLLLLNGRAEARHVSEVSLFSASIIEGLLKQRDAQRNSDNHKVTIVPVAFFCGQHRDWQRDPNGSVQEAAMSLLLQIIDCCGKNINPKVLRHIYDTTNPEELHSICSAIDVLIVSLPRHVFVILIVDGLKYFAQPSERQAAMTELVASLIGTFRKGPEATLKFLFANPTRVEFLVPLFEGHELLNIPRNLRSADSSSKYLVKRSPEPEDV